MLKKRSLICLAILSVTAVLGLACDSSSPTEPKVTIDFNCLLLTASSMDCSGVMTGGKAPFDFFWEADNQAPISGRGVSTTTWNYSRFCAVAPADGLAVTVRMAIVDDGGRGEQRGPIAKSYVVCVEPTEGALGKVMTPADEDWGSEEPLVFWNPGGAR